MAASDLSRYVVKQKIREIGGYLTVFAAHQRGLERDVELRVLQSLVDEDSSLYLKFQAECKALAKLDHPGLLKILDLGHSGERIFYVTDPPIGIPLREYVATGQAPADVAIEVGVQLGQALDYLHARNLLHRGLSLGGINYDLVTGRVLISDFSLLKNPAGNVPSMRELLDTDTFEALPERAYNWPVDERSDLFLAGAILHALLTGADPLAPQSLARVIDFQFPPPGNANPDCPPELDAFVQKAMSREPALRHPSAAEFVRDLENVRRRLVVRRASRTTPTLTGTAVQAVLDTAATQAQALTATSTARPDPPPVPPLAAPGAAARDAARPRAARIEFDDSQRSLLLLSGGATLALVLFVILLKAAFSSPEAPGPKPPAIVADRRPPPVAAGQVSFQASSAAPAPTAGPPDAKPVPLDSKPDQPGAAAGGFGGSSAGGSAEDGAAVALPADPAAAVALARQTATTTKTFTARWEALRSWCDTHPATGTAPAPFSPMDLTAVRLKIYRDPREACLDLDELLGKIE